MAQNFENEKTVRSGSPSSYEHQHPQLQQRSYEEGHMSAGRYAATRLTTLKPPMAKAPNPITLLRMLNFQQWMFFLVAFLAWTWVRGSFAKVRQTSLTNDNRMPLTSLPFRSQLSSWLRPLGRRMPTSRGV
jgi:hypothetical protein